MGVESKTLMDPEEGKSVKISRPPSSLTSDDAEVKVPKRFYRRRSCQICCGITTAILLITAIVILTLSFTVFQSKDPQIKVTGMTLKSFSFKLDSSLTDFTLDVSLHLNVSVHNPNVASFKYGKSSTFLYYRGLQVGNAPVPPGQVGAQKTEKFQTDLEIQALQLAINTNLTSDLQKGSIPINTYSSIRGTLNFINIFKHHATSVSECTTNIIVVNQTLGDFNCVYRIKL